MGEILNPGRILAGDEYELRRSIDAWHNIPVDVSQRMDTENEPPPETCQTTLGNHFYVTGPGTYMRHNNSTLYFEPYEGEGWWFDRLDLPYQLPVRVSVRNVWNTTRSIVLRSGSPHNYIRMVEHIIALRLGMQIDNVIIRMDSGDPPLFDVGSMPIVEGVKRAGVVLQPDRPLTYWAVKEPVTLIGHNGSFLHLEPPESAKKLLSVDCAIDFPNAIGQQRIQFDVTRQTFEHGAHARTNCTQGMMWYASTIGQLFTDVRRMGYTRENILIAAKDHYVNEPRMRHDGKSLEAVWHRATLDLLAAMSLIETGRLIGRMVSYKAGHALDALLVTLLYMHDLLEPVG